MREMSDAQTAAAGGATAPAPGSPAAPAYTPREMMVAPMLTFFRSSAMKLAKKVVLTV